MIQRMTGIQDTKNDQLNESIIECGDMPPAPMEMDRGNPVSINVSMNASGKDHVEDLLDMMKKAGLGGAEEVKPDMMPMRHDMEKFRGMIDGPKDDEPVMKLPAPEDEDMGEGRYDGPNSECCDAPLLNYNDGLGICSDCKEHAGPIDDDVEEEGYDNEPDEEYKDTEFMTKDLAGGINREKKAYKAAQDGDNAMAVETLYKELMSQYKALK